MYSTGTTTGRVHRGGYKADAYSSRGNKHKKGKKQEQQNQDEIQKLLAKNTLPKRNAYESRNIPNLIDLNYFLYESRIKLNVSGKKFEVIEKILENHPETLLGSKTERLKYYDSLRDEYFFDRNREAFESILFFYQTNGRFEIPLYVPIDVFYEEVKYFGLAQYLNSETMCDESLLVCALNDQLKEIQHKISSNEFTKEEIKKDKLVLRNKFQKLKYFYEEDDDDEEMPKNKYQRYLWLLLERPNKSILGRIIAFTCLVTVIISVTIMCMETVVSPPSSPQSNYEKFTTTPPLPITNQSTIDFYPATTPMVAEPTKDDFAFSTSERRVEFFTLELICNSLFTIEIVVRIIAAPKKLKFMKSFSNIIDIVAVVPFWSTLVLNNLNFFYYKLFGKMTQIVSSNAKRQSNQYGLSVLRILRLTRVLRVLKLSRHIRVLNIMGRILYECVYEIVLLLTFLAINIIIFSSLIYYIELHALGEMSPFLSIPHSFWWAVISFTTIGYGDLIPQSAIGKFFGSFFILCGILIALLPVPILSCKFERIYKEFSQEHRIKEEKENNLS